MDPWSTPQVIERESDLWPLTHTNCSLLDRYNNIETSHRLACENIRFSSLFAAGNVSRGEKLRLSEKFHTDDVKYLFGIQSEELIGWWSSYIVFAIVYEWQAKDKRPQKSNVSVKDL